jgi:hypothetical protein
MSCRRIALPDLLAATGYKERDLWELRRRGVFPFQLQHEHVLGMRGSTSSYPLEAVAFLQRHAEIRRQYRLDDEVIPRLWADPAGGALDIRGWVLKRLDYCLDRIKRARDVKLAIAPGAEAEALKTLGIAANVRNQSSRRLALDWIMAWALGNPRPGLDQTTPEATEPTLFDVVIKLLTGFSGMRVSSRSLKLADRDFGYWLARLRRIVEHSFNREIEQARADWRAIFELVEIAESVDWNMAPALIPKGVAKLPPSWAERQTRRQRRKPPPDFIRLIIRWLCDPNGIALSFGVLLIARRLFSRSPFPELPDTWLGIVRQWLNGLPRLLPDQSEQAS